MMRRLGNWMGAWAVLTVVAAVCLAQSPASDDLLLEAEVDLLIDQLGHPEFSRREAATNRLVEIGDAALAQLEQGHEHVDREVRYRCARIVARVRVEQRRRRLAAFLVYQDSAEGDELPAWHRYRELVGDTADARALFAKMLSSEWDLLAHLDEHPAQAADAFVDRCTEIEQARSLYRQTPTLPSVASLLLVAGDEDVSVPDQMGSKLYFLCNQVLSFRDALQFHGKNSHVVRSLVGAWIRTASGSMTGYYCLNLAMNYELREGLGLAEEILRLEGSPVLHKEYAILTIAKLGDAKHLGVLAPLLSDQSICRSLKKPNTNTMFVTQVRDVALAATIYLSGQDPKQFGFDRLQANQVYVFVTTSIGFSSEEDRSRSQQKWDEFNRATNS